MGGSMYTAAGLVNDPITAILDALSKYDIIHIIKGFRKQA
jgi:hypothetical protein